MRCILLNNPNNKEIVDRINYIYKIFHIYTYPINKEGYIELVSFPSNLIDIIIVVGHNNKVYNYITNQNIIEKTVLLITCKIGAISKYKNKNKIIYICKTDNNGIAELRKGNIYGFDFDITLSELHLFNNEQYSLEENIKNTFERMV